MRGRLIFAIILSSAVYAQTSGAIEGRVSDPQGAGVAAAKVSARHLGTGAVRSTASGEEGFFSLSGLPAASYELRVEAPGFQSMVRKNVGVTVGETIQADFPLLLGVVDQVVTVEGSSTPVNTQTSELSYLVGERAIADLPLNGRNYTDLALLQAGVVAFPLRDGGSVVAHGLGVSMNGQDPRSNVYLLDGTPQNDFTNGPAGSAASTVLGMDTIREFRVETNTYSAEYGRSSGGQLNTLTKSGSNAVHGSLFEYWRNDHLDARNFFDSLSKPKFTRNQFGGTAGGPIRKDRLFYFVGLESLGQHLGQTISTVVPDLNSRAGTVSALTRPYLDQFPLPNGASLGGGLANYYFPFNSALNETFGQVRIDWNPSAAHQLFARYTVDSADQFLPTSYPQFPRDFASRNQFATMEDRWIASGRLLHTFRLGFSRTHTGQDVQANVPATLSSFVPGRTMPGGIVIGGIPGTFGPQTSVNVQLVQNVFQFEHGLIYTAGRHVLKSGALAEHYQDNMYNPTFSLGTFTFNTLSDFLAAKPARFLGVPPAGALDRYWRFTLFGFYVQDSFRVNSRLTINAGLRYEFSTMPQDIHGRDSALRNLSDATATVGPLYQNPTHKNFSPRIGFAFDPAGNGKTAIRGGYGLFYNTNTQQNLIPTVTNPPYTPRLVIVSTPAAPLAFPVPNYNTGNSNSIRPIQWNIKNPYVQQWNVNIERELWGGAVATIGYAGARGIHLLRDADVNTAVPQRLADGTLFFPAGGARQNTAWSTIELKSSDGNSWYNAGIFEVRRAWKNGLLFQTSYTFSRNIDTTQASTFFSDSTSDTTSAMPEYSGFSYNKGLADFHAKHNVVVNGSWELPFAHRLQGRPKQFFDGWQLAAIAQMRSGNPLTLFEATNRSRSLWAPSLGPGLGFDRPSMAPGYSYESAVLGGPNQYFNPKAFVLQPAGQLGNMGRGALIGPNLRTVDLSLMKNTRVPGLGETGALQFRIEAFNILNRANFSAPSVLAFTGAADGESPLSTLGIIRSTVTSSRQIQLGLRLVF